MADESDNNLGSKAAFAAGAAIGSAAVAAALLFVKRRSKSRANEKPPHPEDAPETD